MASAKFNIKINKGQSIIELMIGITIAVILISGATASLAVTLRSSLQNKFLRTASSLAQDLLDKVTVFSEQNWHNIYDLDKSPNKWRLVLSGGNFSASTGMETLIVDDLTYERYFTVTNVQRDVGDNIVMSGGSDDPSTQLVTVTVTWLAGGQTASLTRQKYITRIKNLSWRSISPGNGNESDVFDSGVSGGVAPNTIKWQGSGGTVGFRIASANTSTGPWSYLGPNGNPAAYYQPAGPNMQARITLADHNNKRYFRYKIFYLSGSPQVSEVILNYSL